MKKKIFLLISLIGVLLIFTNLSQGWQSAGGKNRDFLPINPEGHPNQDDALCSSLPDKNNATTLDKVILIPFGKGILVFTLSKIKIQTNSKETKTIPTSSYKKQK